jgi:GAF domain-containing protein
VTGTRAGRTEPGPVPPHVAALCREYAALAAAAAVGLADFLDDVAALAVRTLPTARSARIRVRDPEVVTAVADVGGREGAPPGGVLAIPLVGRGDLTGVLELASAGDGFPVQERELAEVLAVLLTLSLAPAA